MWLIPALSRARPFLSRAYSMKVVPVPVRDDNYAYLLIDEATKTAAAVDPYDVQLTFGFRKVFHSHFETTRRLIK
jgi:hypothetical protein